MTLRVSDHPGPDVAIESRPPRRRTYTLEQWLKLPEQPRTELVEGMLKKMPNGTLNHDAIIFNLRTAIKVYLLLHKRGRVFGEVNVLIDGLTGADGWIPDGVFISKSNPAKIGCNIEGRPEWVLEVWAGDEKRSGRIKEKRERWQRAGVPELWEIVLRGSKQAVKVYRLDEQGIYRVRPSAGETICSEVIEGFCIERAAIFADLVAETQEEK